MKRALYNLVTFLYFLNLPSLHAQNQPPVWIEIVQGGFPNYIIFSRYGVIVSTFDYNLNDRLHLFNTSYYPTRTLGNSHIDSLLEYVVFQYQNSEHKKFITHDVLILDGSYTEIRIHNGHSINTLRTTEECYSKEMDIIERMANQILSELSDSNRIDLGGYCDHCEIVKASPYCHFKTMENPTFYGFFFQMIVDDEVLLTLHDDLGILYQDTDVIFIPRFPNRVKRHEFMNWRKLLYQTIRTDILQSQFDTTPSYTGGYLLVRLDDKWAYMNHVDRKVINKWLNKMECVVPRAYRKSFKRKKTMILQSWNKNVSNI